MPPDETTLAAPGVTAAHEFFSGVREAVPIVLGYLPIGFAYGIIAAKTGLSTLETVLMSVLVYAGASQFIAAGLIAAGAGCGTIVATTFLVNLRHLLMSAALFPWLRGLRTPTRAGLAFELTDETFALATTVFQKRAATAPFLAGLQLTAQFTWVLSSLAGALSGSLLTSVNRFGLDFALPAMFIALLVLQLRSRVHLAAAGIAAVCSLLFAQLIPGNWNVILAAVIAATAGMFLEGGSKNRAD